MDLLKQRLAKRTESFKKLIRNERLLEEVFGKIFTEELRDDVTYTIYENSLSVYFTTNDPELIYLELIPKISEEFGGNWMDFADDTGLTFIHSTNTTDRVQLVFSFRLHLADTCSVKRVATGRTILRSHYEQREEREYTYQFICGGE